MPPELVERVAVELGWTTEQVQSFSLPSIRDIVREVSPKLAHEITLAMADTCRTVSRAAKERHCDLMRQGFMKGKGG